MDIQISLIIVFGYLVGIKLESFFQIIGLGFWQIILSLISGFAGKELIVSTLQQSLAGYGQSIDVLLNDIGFGTINAISLMIFCLLYTPCMATVGTIKKETKSLRFTIGSAFLQFFIAYVFTLFVYQIIKLFFLN